MAPNFELNVSTNVAGLTALKGGAPASTDIAWICEAATLTIDANCTLMRTYQGDNSGGTAAVKTGNLTVGTDATLTFYDTTLYRGFDGNNAAGNTTIIQGTPGHIAKILCNTVDVVTNYNNRAGD